MKEEIQTANQVCKLIKNCGFNKQKLNRNKKIKFAYKYWNLNPEDITILYEKLAENYSVESAKLAEIIGEFLDYQEITSLKRFNVHFFDQDLEAIKNVTSKIRTNGNWLSLYNIEKEFDTENILQRPVRYSYLTQDEKIFSIDKDRANEILGILTAENIPTAKCIVIGSFKDYANNNIESYIKTLKKIK